MTFKAGDLVKTTKGNLAIVTASCVIDGQVFLDVLFLKTQYLRTGFPGCRCEVINESR